MELSSFHGFDIVIWIHYIFEVRIICLKDNRALLATLFCLLVTMWVSSAQHRSFPRPLCPHSRLLSGPAPPGYIYCDCERCIISWSFVGDDVTCDPL